MEPNIKSSFIPSDTVQTKKSRGPINSGLTDIFVLGAIVLFIASLALGIGVFLYYQFLQSSLASKSEQIQRAEEAFEPGLIQELTRLDDRMRAGEAILHQHMAPSEIFALLQDLTLVNVSFSSFELAAADPGSISITLDGLARSVNSIALQADLFARHGAITSPIFSNINRDTQGVRFEVTALLNPAALRYANVHQARTQQASQPQQLQQPQQPPQQSQQTQPAQEQTAGEETQEDTSIPLFAP